MPKYKNLTKWQKTSNYHGRDWSDYYYLHWGIIRDSCPNDKYLFDDLWGMVKEQFEYLFPDRDMTDRVVLGDFGNAFCGWERRILIHKDEKEMLEYCDKSLYDEDDYECYFHDNPYGDCSCNEESEEEDSIS